MSATAAATPQAMPEALRRPVLKPGIAVFRHRYRGQPWYVLHDRAAHRLYRVSASGAEVVGAMDGERPMGEIVQSLAARPDVPPPDSRRIGQFLMQLHSLGLLRDPAPDAAALTRRRRQEARRSLMASLRNPLSFKLGLFDPTPLLDRLAPRLGWIFGPFGLALWLAVVAMGAVIGLMHWGPLAADFSDQLFSAQNLLLVGLVYPVVKAIHELGHGLALRHCGVECRQVGLLFAAFFPVPFVDATAAATLERKTDRMLIGAAGILAELFIGSIALALWAAAEPGLLRSICYNVILVSGFSTLLFNGNPLQRFDGYYVLADAVEIPGLGTRAGLWLGWAFRRFILGDASQAEPAGTPGERLWFALYGPASFVYRFGLMLAIAFMVAEQYAEIGIGLGIWATIGYCWPLVGTALRGVQRAPAEGRSRAAFGLGALVLGVLALLFVVPAPHRSLAEGVVAMPEEAAARAGIGGTVAALLVAPGAAVAPGTPLARLEEPAVEARLARAAGRVAELAALQQMQYPQDRVKAANTAEQLRQAERELAEAERDRRNLLLVSPAAGELVLPNPTDLPGRFLQRGDQLGIVYDGVRAVVRVLVPMDQIGLVRDGLRAVSIRPAFAIETPLPARLARISPSATELLPNAALGLDGGGTHAVTPDRNGAQRLAEPAYLVELAPETPLARRFLEGRVHVRFAFDPEPLGFQLWRRIRLAFLRHLHA
ncbi:PqqD family peptide modification chaperone [Belnapia sp. T6]|uniref:PqqD family peptide modification chaperone n=1 Tax=Belnapia mucosa TaxID=2804532 RepID=A0ABS1VA29_9PROT|nr:PqqD family peptide modification chaperone [Belnapia mucosa]MBL6458519.1 PqqD family peptide modification chaperone [Belnapia mucosa]